MYNKKEWTGDTVASLWYIAEYKVYDCLKCK